LRLAETRCVELLERPPLRAGIAEARVVVAVLDVDAGRDALPALGRISSHRRSPLRCRAPGRSSGAGAITTHRRFFSTGINQCREPGGLIAGRVPRWMRARTAPGVVLKRAAYSTVVR